jgi:hypothetical protein
MRSVLRLFLFVGLTLILIPLPFADADAKGPKNYSDGPVWQIFQPGGAKPVKWKVHKPNPRFAIYSNGSANPSDDLVWDRQTDLVWERKPNNFRGVWWSAENHCYESNLGFVLGWRFPTIEELATLIDPTEAVPPALPSGHPFVEVIADGEFYWSSTTNATQDMAGLGVWIADFGSGIVGVTGKQNLYRTWCVRGGQGHDLR